ncbi:hypothetical protein QBC41DRAFT_365427 [Cercophora samala]|uniref:Uncharacterized protein n=1 Tax=Cercophora samala TaxID=330535 RepID=A0AA39ZCR5_9PEZI|nr:hypothetical protein QBC41DRAFT_365427 [Cercophora samala]
MSVNYNAVGWAQVAMQGIAIVLGVYVLARLALDLATRRGLASVKKHQDDVESDTPPHTRCRGTAILIVALAGVISTILTRILELVTLFHHTGYKEELSQYSAVNFFAIAEGLCLFVTAILMTKALTSPAKGFSVSRIMYTVLIVLLAVFALVVFIIQTLQIWRHFNGYMRLWRPTAILGHTYFALLGFTTLVIGVSLIRKLIQIRGANIPTAERSALKMFTFVALPVLTGMIVLGIVSRVGFTDRPYYYFFDDIHGYLAYAYISLIFNIWLNLLVFEFARKAVKKLSTI